MTQHCMRSYTQLVIKTCHRRGVHAMGGMAAQIPIKGNPSANQVPPIPVLPPVKSPTPPPSPPPPIASIRGGQYLLYLVLYYMPAVHVRPRYVGVATNRPCGVPAVSDGGFRQHRAYQSKAEAMVSRVFYCRMLRSLQEIFDTFPACACPRWDCKWAATGTAWQIRCIRCCQHA